MPSSGLMNQYESCEFAHVGSGGGTSGDRFSGRSSPDGSPSWPGGRSAEIVTVQPSPRSLRASTRAVSSVTVQVKATVPCSACSLTFRVPSATSAPRPAQPRPSGSLASPPIPGKAGTATSGRRPGPGTVRSKGGRRGARDDPGRGPRGDGALRRRGGLPEDTGGGLSRRAVRVLAGHRRGTPRAGRRGSPLALPRPLVPGPRRAHRPAVRHGRWTAGDGGGRIHPPPGRDAPRRAADRGGRPLGG